jgi:hypothetical protein
MVAESSIKEIWHGAGFNYYREMHLKNKGGEISLCSTCPDWKYRSWHHNYWKVIEGAESQRLNTFKVLGIEDDFLAKLEP